MSKSITKHLPSAPPGENGAEPATPSLLRPQSGHPRPAPSPSPGASASSGAISTTVTAMQVALGYRQSQDGVEVGQDALVVNIPLSPGMDLEAAYIQAVRAVLEGLIKLRGGGPA
jgi:hypothetical protein